MTSLRPPVICMVTDGRRFTRTAFLQRVADAAAAGVDLIHLRERDLDDRGLLQLAAEVLRATDGSACRVVVNDRTDVALAAGAAGVHLRSDSVSAADVRRITPPGFLIGRSVHHPHEAASAAAEGACDYLVFGTVFPSRSKTPGHTAAGAGRLADAVRRARGHGATPVLAIGGIDLEGAREVAAAGAGGVAAIGLFAESSDLRRVVAALRELFDTSAGVV